MQAFRIDPESPISVKLQLKAQVIYQIQSGLLKPGDQLPSLRDLAAGLGVNLNTVVRALAEVEAEGYIISEQGRGIFVADEFPCQGISGGLRGLVVQANQRAGEWGLEPVELALAMLAHGSLARPPGAPQHRILVAAGSRQVMRRLRMALEAALPAVVDTVLVDDLPELPRIHEYKAAVTTPFYAREVAGRFPGVLATAPDPWPQLKDLPAGTPVAIVTRDWVQGARIRRTMETAGLAHLALGVFRAPVPPTGLDGYLHIVAAGDGLDVAEQVAEERMVTVVTEPVDLPASVLHQLRTLLDAPVQAQRMVSAWI